jgi:hypothetical protein
VIACWSMRRRTGRSRSLRDSGTAPSAVRAYVDALRTAFGVEPMLRHEMDA